MPDIPATWCSHDLTSPYLVRSCWLIESVATERNVQLYLQILKIALPLGAVKTFNISQPVLIHIDAWTFISYK